eukprot:gene15810-37948_t
MPMGRVLLHAEGVDAERARPAAAPILTPEQVCGAAPAGGHWWEGRKVADAPTHHERE